MKTNLTDNQYSYMESLYKKKPFRLMTPKERIDWLWAQMKYKYDSGREIIKRNSDRKVTNCKPD